MADRPSLLLLQHLARHLGSSRLAVVGTYRETDLDRQHPLSEILVESRREHLHERVRLRGVSEAEITDLLEAVFQQDRGPRTEALAGAIYQETEGNPFFVEETIRHLVDSGAVHYRDGRWDSDAGL